MIIGIACIPLAFFIKLWTIPVAIVGIIVGACHKGKDNKKTAGIALSAASIPIAVIVAIVAGIFELAVIAIANVLWFFPEDIMV